MDSGNAISSIQTTWRQAMSVARDTETMITTLRHLMAPEGTMHDFTMPSLLRDVPSFTSADSANPREVILNAEFWSRSGGDR